MFRKNKIVASVSEIKRVSDFYRIRLHVEELLLKGADLDCDPELMTTIKIQQKNMPALNVNDTIQLSHVEFLRLSLHQDTVYKISINPYINPWDIELV